MWYALKPQNLQTVPSCYNLIEMSHLKQNKEHEIDSKAKHGTCKLSTYPLLIGGEVGDRDGHALLGGGSSSASSSEELSSVRSIISTFLLSPPCEELFRWSDDVRHESKRAN